MKLLILVYILIILASIPSTCSTTRSKNNNNIETEDALKVRQMYIETYENYLKYAYPHDELKPLSCSGARTLGNYSLTLIDSLDGLVMLGDEQRFFEAVEKVSRVSFDLDINVSVFETNIRILGYILLLSKDV